MLDNPKYTIVGTADWPQFAPLISKYGFNNEHPWRGVLGAILSDPTSSEYAEFANRSRTITGKLPGLYDVVYYDW